LIKPYLIYLLSLHYPCCREFDREPISTSSSGFSPSTTATTRKASSTPPRPVTAESAQELIEELLDPERFGTRGEAWFFAQLILILLVAFPPSGLRQIVDVAGYCCLAAGLAFITLGGLNLGQNLTPVPKPRDMHSLVTEGTYQLVRHPMYGGIILAAAGLSLASGDEARLALTALTFYVLDQKATVEEEYLEERYPAEYAEYKRSGVKKLIPWLY
jgi:protein-S-isoprenylcysteine O-methyltransferase Ste14